MKTREVTIPDGSTFTVPQGIQRIDSKSTHGWQVRYQGTRFFSDGAPGEAAASASLEKATKELLARINRLPAPTVLKQGPSAHKTSDLPPGISGPIVTPARGRRTRGAVLSVLLPRFGQDPQVKSIYIGSESTYSAQRFEAAVEKAITLRTEAVDRYRLAATRAKRKQGAELRASRRMASVDAAPAAPARGR